ncbi:MAG: hypothetical protein ACJAW4_003413 [Paracoccaceae bacterium]|jgi:hypothetical protein
MRVDRIPMLESVFSAILIDGGGKQLRAAQHTLKTRADAIRRHLT